VDEWTNIIKQHQNYLAEQRGFAHSLATWKDALSVNCSEKGDKQTLILRLEKLKVSVHDNFEIKSFSI
jgi:hypothetical protein